MKHPGFTIAAGHKSVRNEYQSTQLPASRGEQQRWSCWCGVRAVPSRGELRQRGGVAKAMHCACALTADSTRVVSYSSSSSSSRHSSLSVAHALFALLLGGVAVGRVADRALARRSPTPCAVASALLPSHWRRTHWQSTPYSSPRSLGSTGRNLASRTFCARVRAADLRPSRGELLKTRSG